MQTTGTSNKHYSKTGKMKMAKYSVLHNTPYSRQTQWPFVGRHMYVPLRIWIRPRCGDRGRAWGGAWTGWRDSLTWQTWYTLIDRPLNCLGYGRSNWPWKVIRHVCVFPRNGWSCDLSLALAHTDYVLSCIILIELNHDFTDIKSES